MTAQEYVEQLFTRHDIDWLDMQCSAYGAVVWFLYDAVTTREQLNAVGKNAFSKIEIIPDDGRSIAIFSIEPHKLEERTLTQAISNILRSTRDLHTRFNTSQDITKALQVLLGEVEELRAEVAAGDTEKALHESLDVFVTLISLWIALGVDDATLVAMLDTIAGKNDAKDDTSHVLHEGVITRRDKLV